MRELFLNISVFYVTEDGVHSLSTEKFTNPAVHLWCIALRRYWFQVGFIKVLRLRY